MNRVGRLLLSVLSTYAFVGVIQPHLHLHLHSSPLNELNVAHILTLSPLFFFWCKADAAARNIRPPTGAPLLVGLMPLIAVPCYFFRTYTPGPALAKSGKAFAFLVGANVLQSACFLISARIP